MDGEQHQVTLTGRLDAFGFQPSRVQIDAIARSNSWRMTRALLAVGIGIGIAPVAALVPPHIPWVLAALIGGTVVAGRRLTEHFTLRSMAANCPRCGEPVTTEPGRLTADRTVRCTACGQDLALTVELT